MVSTAMIETVQVRQRGAFCFEDHYDNLCALQDTGPLAAVKAHLAKGVIDLNGDRIRLNDWQPIINSIKINKSLQFIAIRSYYQVPTVEDEKRAAIIRRKLPAIRSKEITHRFIKALKDCLFVSPTLSCIELQGLALRERDIQVLAKGISKSQTLRHLSLEGCRIGDVGLEVLCNGLKNTKNINSINLSSCSISPKGAESLAALIKHQGTQRHSEAWQDSLRYRRPDLDRMSGIRRITANNNPMLGDEGAQLLAETLKDDLWLKALDLQGCGISTAGAKSFLDVLEYNITLVVLDLRGNPLVEEGIIKALVEHLFLNSSKEDEEYKWMKADDSDDQTVKQSAKTRRRATKVLNSSVGKKTTIKVTPTSSRRKGRTPVVMPRRYEVHPSRGFPWRTAARANRFRGHPPDTPRFLTDQSADVSSSTTHGNDNSNMDADGACTRSDLSLGLDSSSRMKRITAEATASMKKLEESHLSLDLSNQRDVLVELEQMRRHLKEERLARARADQQVITLMIENRRLREEMSLLQKSQRHSGGFLEDESFLESIEAAFNQFHAFIDMLKEAGLGQLVSMAGLDQAQMPVINGNINYNNNFTQNVPPFLGSSNNNGGAGNGRNGFSFSQSKTLNSAAVYSTNVAPDTSAFVNGQHKPAGQAADLISATSREAPVMVAVDTGKSQPLQATVYDEESEIARQEADELYSRLVKETRVALGQDDEALAAGTTFSRPGLAASVTKASAEGSERHSPDQDEEREHVRLTTQDSFEDTTSQHILLRRSSRVDSFGEESSEELSSYRSVRGKQNGQQDARDVVSLLEADDSKDDF